MPTSGPDAAFSSADESSLLARLRAGIRPARTIEADVAFTREMYGRLKPNAAVAVATARQRITAVVLNYRTPDDTVLAPMAYSSVRSQPMIQAKISPRVA